MATVIHVSPHPDDESIAAPCTLLALQRHGWHVVNYAVSLGRPGDRERRRLELSQALGHTRTAGAVGFEDLVLDPGIEISRHDDLGTAAQLLTRRLRELIGQRRPELIVGPHPRDGHHGHVAVALAIRQALWSTRNPPVWWMWSIWSDLPKPTLIADCATEDIATSELMLKEYKGENRRTDYVAGTSARRQANAVFGIEKAFGWGSAQSDAAPTELTHAEVLTEVSVRRPSPIGRPRSWMVARPRLLDPNNALDASWIKLRDLSILTPARFRALTRPIALSLLANHRWAQPYSFAEPLPTDADAERLRRPWRARRPPRP